MGGVGGLVLSNLPAVDFYPGSPILIQWANLIKCNDFLGDSIDGHFKVDSAGNVS